VIYLLKHLAIFKYVAVTLFLCLLCSGANAANETDFLKLWQLHMKQPDQHAEVVEACRDFVTKNRVDELIKVVQGVEAWHLLKSGQEKDAIALLQSHLSNGERGPDAGAAILAKAWLSRLDLEDVKQALQLYYRKEVGYPERLDDLTGHPGTPPTLKYSLTDRWNRPWSYRLTGLKSTPGFRNQHYSIACTKLADSSNINDGLALPYAGSINVRATGITTIQGGRSIVELATWHNGREQGQRVQLGVDRITGDIFLAYVGSKLIIVCDHNHWKVLPKPR